MICTRSYIVYSSIQQSTSEGGTNTVFDLDKLGPSIGKFKNCISITINNINLKIFKIGDNRNIQPAELEKTHTSNAYKIVISGCKTIEDAKHALKNIACHGTFYLVPIMTNNTFKVDFKIINLLKLSDHIHRTTSYNALYDIDSLSLKVVIPLNDILNLPVYIVKLEGEDSMITYGDFLKLNFKVKDKSNTNISMSIFSTGSVILKGLDDMYNLPIIEWFISETEKYKSDFECGMDKVSFKSFIDI